MKGVLPMAMCLVEQTLNPSPFKPTTIDVNNLTASTPNHYLLDNRTDCLPHLPCAEEFIDHRKLFRQIQAY